MSDLVRTQYEEVKKLIAKREVTVERIFTDPIAHAVAHVLRCVRDADGSDRETAIVDGTGAIMALFDGEDDG